MKIPKVIAVWSPKAGAGKSFVAANLAYEFAKNNILTAVLDFDTICPSQENFLDMKVNDDVNINKAIKEENEQRFLSYFTQNQKYKNLFLLANGKSTSIDACYKVEYKEYVSLIDRVKEKFECVIIDCMTPYMDSGTMAALIQSEKIVTVLKQDYLDVYNFIRYENFFEKINIVKWKHLFILNGTFNSVLEKNKILQMLKLSSIIEIPQYKDMNLLNNAIIDDSQIMASFNKIFDTVTSNIVISKIEDKKEPKLKIKLFSFNTKKKNIKEKSISIVDLEDEKDEEKVNNANLGSKKKWPFSKEKNTDKKIDEQEETSEESIAIKKVKKKYDNILID